MGIIDSTYYRLSCAKCEMSETIGAHEKGSSFGSSGWQELSSSEFFNVVNSNERPSSSPEVDSASCKSCGESAKVENHMWSKPKGW